MGPNESLIKVVIIINLTIYLQRTSNKILINKHGSPRRSGGWWWCSGSGAAMVVLVLLAPLSPSPLPRCWWWGFSVATARRGSATAMKPWLFAL